MWGETMQAVLCETLHRAFLEPAPLYVPQLYSRRGNSIQVTELCSSNELVRDERLLQSPSFEMGDSATEGTVAGCSSSSA